MMFSTVYIFPENRELQEVLSSFAKRSDVSNRVVSVKDIKQIQTSAEGKNKDVLFVDYESLKSQDDSLEKLNKQLLEISMKAILMVKTREELEGNKFLNDYESIFMVIPEDFDDTRLLSCLKMFAAQNQSNGCGLKLNAEDLININTLNIKYRHDLLGMVNFTNEGMWLWDLTKNVFHISDLFRKALGYSTVQLHDNIEEFTNLIHPEDKKSFRLSLSDYLHHKETKFSSEVRLKTVDGGYKWFLFRGYAVWDANDIPTQILGFQLDIHKMKTRLEVLENLALNDPLTNLPNRNLLYDRLTRGIINSSRERKMLGLLFIDLDDFKKVNDTYGHKVGDLVLIETAKRLQQCVRKIDTIGRLHGDEFVIILAFLSSAEDIMLFTKRINQAFQKEMVIEGHSIAVTCSIGTSVYPRDGETIEDLLEQADISMYKRKNIYKTLYKSLKG